MDNFRSDVRVVSCDTNMTIFFTADNHFGHSNIIRHCARPFASALEMNEVMIERWNSVVKPKDQVYHLGDVSVLRPEKTREILDRLNGKIYLIRGNHDKSAEHKLCCDRFEWIKDYYFLKLPNNISIALMHYAMRVWNKSHYGSWHLYAHSHGNLKIPPELLCLDVGVDAWDFTPVSFEQVRGIMEEKGWKGLSVK